MRTAILTFLLLGSALAVADSATERWRDAIVHNRVQDIRALLAQQDDVDQPTEYGKTALMAAAGVGDSELVTALLSAGADSNATNHLDGTVLMFAAGSGDPETLRQILATGVAINAQASNGWSAVMMATAKNHADLLRKLATAGADPNLADVYGWTPLMRAAFDHHEAAFAALLEWPGLDLEATNRNGQTALHLAVIGGHAEMVKTLVERGAVQARDRNGYTPQAIAKELARADLQVLLDTAVSGD